MTLGRMVMIHVLGKIGAESWAVGNCPYQLPAGYRPPVEVQAACAVWNGQTSRMIVASPNGSIRCMNLGSAGSAQQCAGTLTFLAAD